MIRDYELRRATRHTLAVIMAGGRGSRLHNLTDNRAKPAVYFGGKFRIIDFALSNCVNSGMRRIAVLTQYKSHSLLRHIQHGWSFLRGEMGEYVDLIPAQQRVDENKWYEGTADALYQNIDIMQSSGAKWIVVLAGDHVYKMDYTVMLGDHIRNGADVTVACLEVPRLEATGFGVMDTDKTGAVTKFLEKPKNPPGMPENPDMALASMGIYIFNAAFLYEQLKRDANNKKSSHDFGKDIIPSLIGKAKIRAHSFNESCVTTDPSAPIYWKDVGTIDSYWEANIDLTTVTPSLDLYNRDWPIFTYQEQLPPAKFVFDRSNRRGSAIDSIVSSGCIVSGSTIRNSLLANKVRVNSYCKIKGAVLLPEVIVGRHVSLENVVVDRGCVLPEGLVVGKDPELDAKRFFRTDKGVTLITPKMLKKIS